MRIVLKNVKITAEEAMHKAQKKQKNKLEVIYLGHWINDRRNGIGKSIFRNGDSYYGQFKDDQMEGRGKYFYNSFESPSVCYLGEMKENMF